MVQLRLFSVMETVSLPYYSVTNETAPENVASGFEQIFARVLDESLGCQHHARLERRGLGSCGCGCRQGEAQPPSLGFDCRMQRIAAIAVRIVHFGTVLYQMANVVWYLFLDIIRDKRTQNNYFKLTNFCITAFSIPDRHLRLRHQLLVLLSVCSLLL